MLYSIVSEDVTDSIELRAGARPSHIERLKNLQNMGRLVLAGPSPAIDSIDPGNEGFTGSLIVAEFNSLAEARQWADEDPYVKAGIYKTVIVKPFKKVFPA